MSPRKSQRIYNMKNNKDKAFVEKKVLKRKKSTLQTIENISANDHVKDNRIEKNQNKKYKLNTSVNSEDAENLQMPTAEKDNAIKQRKNEEYLINEKETMLRLNDVCLVQIFSYLSIIDLINMERVCSRFRDIVTLHCYKLYEVIELDEVFYERKINPRVVLKRIGKYIKDIGNTVMNHDEDTYTIRLTEMIPEYCKNLEIIRYDKLGDFYEDILIKYLPLFKQLKILYLPRCQISDRIFAKLMRSTKFLLKFKLTFCHDLKGQGLHKLKYLTHLNIHGSFNIKPKFFTKFCENNKTLEYLNIINCSCLIGKNFHDIAEYLCNLNHLAISNNYLCKDTDLYEITKLEKLKTIEFEYDWYEEKFDFDFLINKLAERDQLEIIELHNVPISLNLVDSLAKFSKLCELLLQSENITDNGLYKIVNKGICTRLSLLSCIQLTSAGILKCVELCPSLKVLNITGCKQLNANFILELVDVLRNRKPCQKLFVTASKFYFPDFLENHKLFLIENKDLIGVTLNIW